MGEANSRPERLHNRPTGHIWREQHGQRGGFNDMQAMTVSQPPPPPPRPHLGGYASPQSIGVFEAGGPSSIHHQQSLRMGPYNSRPPSPPPWDQGASFPGHQAGAWIGPPQQGSVWQGRPQQTSNQFGGQPQLEAMPTGGLWPRSPMSGSPSPPIGSAALWSPQNFAGGPPQAWQANSPLPPAPGGFSPFTPSLASRGQFPTALIAGSASPLLYAHGQEVVSVNEIETLSRRVQDVLQKCSARQSGSQADRHDMSGHREVLGRQIREAEDDFERMGLDWRSIEDELKEVREMLLRDIDLSPRARSKLLDSMVHDPPGMRSARLAAVLKAEGTGIKSALTPHSDDLSTELVSTAATESHRRGEESGELTDASTLAGILAAARQSSDAAAHQSILDASRGVMDSSVGSDDALRAEGHQRRSLGEQDATEPSLQDVDSRCSMLEARLEQRVGGRERGRASVQGMPRAEQDANEVGLSSPYAEIADTLAKHRLDHCGLLPQPTPVAQAVLPPPPSPYYSDGFFSPERERPQAGNLARKSIR